MTSQYTESSLSKIRNYLSTSFTREAQYTNPDSNLSSEPLSELFSCLSAQKLLLHPKTIQEFESICCLCYCNKEVIAGGSASGMIVIWKNYTRAIAYCCKSAVNTIVHSNKHQRIYAGTESGEIVRWSYARTDNQLAVIPRHRRGITGLVLFGDDSFMLSAGKDCKIYLWYLTVRRTPVELNEHAREITALKINKDNTRLYSSDADGLIVIWSIEYVESIHVLQRLYGNCAVEHLELCGGVLLSADAKGKLVKWSLEDYSQICSVEFPSKIVSMCKSTDDYCEASKDRYLFFLLSSVIDFSIRAITIDKMDIEKMFVIPADHQSAVNCLCTIPNSNRLVSASDDKTLKIWDFGETYEMRELIARDNGIHSIAVNEALDLIITGDNCGRIQFYKTDGGRRKKVLAVKEGCEVNSILITSDKMFIVACEGRKIVIWRPESKSIKGEVLGETNGHSEDIASICESPDSRYLYTVSTDKTIKVWDMLMKTYKTSLGENKNIENTRKSEIFGHRNDVVDVKATKNYIFTGSLDGFVIVWSGKTYEQLKKLEFGAEVKSISASNTEKCVAAAGKGKNILVWWNFLNIHYRHELVGHDADIVKIIIYGSDNLLYSGSSDFTVKIWSLDQGIILFSIRVEGLQDIFVPASQKFLYAVSVNRNLNKVYQITNPLFANSISVYPPEYSYFFKSYVKKIMCHDSNIYDEFWQDYVIFPHSINLAYVFINAVRPNLLKVGMSRGLKFFKNKLGESPLSWAMQRNNTQCADVILKKLSKIKLKDRFLIIEAIENEMNNLIAKNLSCLPQLFENMFEFITEGVETTGKLKKKAPMICISSSRELKQEEFLDEKASTKKKEFLEYRTSLCKFHFAVGSYDSLKLLQSIANCHNSELFRTQMLKAFLQFKWRQAYYILVIETLLFCIGLLIMTLYVISSDRENELDKLIILLVFNTAGVLQDFTKAYYSPIHFIKNAWNLLNLCRISLVYYYIIRHLIIDTPDYLGLELVTLCYWARAIGYFRIFNKYRYLLRVIMEIIKDMIPFFLILFTSSIAFSMLLCVSQGDISFYSAFVSVYLLDQTNFFFKLDSIENVLVFFLASLLNPIIMLNLLIAIMGDTYDRVQEDQIVADYREMTELILEAEYLIFWNKLRSPVFNFITRCDYMRNLNLEKNEWMGKIRAVKKSLQALEGRFKATGRNIDLVQVNLLEKLNDVVSVSSTLSRRLKDVQRN